MISEQTATHTPIAAVRAQSFAQPGTVINVASTRSTGWRTRLHVVITQAKAVTIVLLRVLASFGSPSFFELERRGPNHQRLGPALSRESDSFWPPSEW
jgi:hypothetical protein